ncbi:hypothetical protein KJ845_01355 [Patescibacteria group bacterium]|nr:hypothetical protein [Patescibacteria group bacterium]
MDKSSFLRRMDEQWGRSVELRPERDGRIVYAYFRDWKKRFYGYANDPDSDKERMEEKARRKLYEEAWSFFTSLKKNEKVLGKEPLSDLRRFMSMLG